MPLIKKMPSGGEIIIKKHGLGSIMIGYQYFVIELITFLDAFDVILGMIWMAKYGVALDCLEKKT